MAQDKIEIDYVESGIILIGDIGVNSANQNQIVLAEHCLDKLNNIIDVLSPHRYNTAWLQCNRIRRAIDRQYGN